MIDDTIFQKDNPFELFNAWFELAKQKQADATEMALATVDEKNCPHVRMVLLKHCDLDGFVFFTNLSSHKAQQLQHNPNASLCFYWSAIGRQIRITGIASQIADDKADAYFATRDRGSQLGAWASKQSQELEKKRFATNEMEKSTLRNRLKRSVHQVPRQQSAQGSSQSP